MEEQIGVSKLNVILLNLLRGEVLSVMGNPARYCLAAVVWFEWRSQSSLRHVGLSHASSAVLSFKQLQTNKKSVSNDMRGYLC